MYVMLILNTQSLTAQFSLAMSMCGKRKHVWNGKGFTFHEITLQPESFAVLKGVTSRNSLSDSLFLTWLILRRGVGKVQWYSAGLRAEWSVVRVPVGAGHFSPQHRFQTGSGAHPTSYPMGTRGSFPVDKVAGAWSWPLTSI
jgi:hypothetical protein